jgi:hydroxymethylpyrimidine pyrophosphatase-like HAD family hydrolase
LTLGAASTQVNGDSGNDVELFEVEGVQGCVVANAHPELDAFYQANQSPTIYKVGWNRAARACLRVPACLPV